MLIVQISSVGHLFQQLKKSRAARLALIRKFICTRREIPVQSFQSWLQEQQGMHDATEAELDEFYRLTFESNEDEILETPRKR
jgi:hypothetical protein